MLDNIKKRWKKAVNTDNIIDFSVDVGLIAFDVLASPILIVVRIARFYFKKFVNKHLKRFLKWFVHKVLRIKQLYIVVLKLQEKLRVHTGKHILLPFREKTPRTKNGHQSCLYNNTMILYYYDY